MKQSFYVYNNGDLKRKDNTLQFTNYDGEKRDIPIERISDIYVMSEMSFNTAFLNYISKYGISIHFFNYYNYYTGSYYPKDALLAGGLLVKQAEYYSDYEKRLQLAKKFLQAAAENIYRNLRYYNGRGKDVESQMKEIDRLRNTLSNAETIEMLMGIEGNIRQHYYAAWNAIVNQEINFNKRVMHPPDNMINSLISFVNSLIYAKTLSEVYHTQLNPTISYLHEPGSRRFSLSLDIAEIFKPLIIDPIIFSLINNKRLTKKDFMYEDEICYLSEEGKKKFLSEFENKMTTTIKHRKLNRKVSYRYFIRLECYKLIKHFIGDEKYKVLKAWW